MQGIHRANVVAVRVCQQNAHNRRVKLARRLQHGFGAAGEVGIHQGKAVVFAHKIAAKRAQAGKLIQRVAMQGRFHQAVPFFCFND
jgi:hypothetical protein